ncbi:MAG: hypothetical protein AB7T06_16275 [Kofleriaceae bacterium]
MRWVAVLVTVAMLGCGGGNSFWLASPTPSGPPPDRTCWDACHARWNPKTAELAKCVSTCPNVEKRSTSCPESAANQCVGDNRAAVAIILIAGVVAVVAIVAGALLL